MICSSVNIFLGIGTLIFLGLITFFFRSILTQFLTRIRLAQKLRTKIEKKQNQKTFNRLKTLANQIRQNFHLYKTKKKQSFSYPKG